MRERSVATISSDASVVPIPRAADARPRVYLFLLFLPVFVLLLLVWVASTDWFMAHNAYPGLRSIGYELKLVHEDCEVVLYGDSSALTGYDPAIVQRITGLKTCNVSEGGTILSIVGPYPLDTYLSHNRRPKYLVMMFTPSIYWPSPNWMHQYQPEGYVYLLHYVKGRRLYYCLLSRPVNTILFANWVGLRLIDDFLQRLEGKNPDDPAKDAGVFRAQHHGLGTFPLPHETQCIRTAFHYRPEAVKGDPKGVAAAREKYGVGGTRVFINVAPVPTCDVLQDTYERVLQGEHDNAFERLPIEWFNSEDVHFDAAGQNYLSTEVGNQILTAERQSTARGN